VQGQKKSVTTRHRWRPRCRIAHGWKKEWKFRLSTTWHPSLHFIFFHLIHPSHIFLATPLFSFSSFSFILSYTYIFFFLYFSIIFFFSFPHSYFSLYFPLSWHLFKALNSSLSYMHTIWNFKQTMLETRRNFESRLCSRNVMYKRDV
jgi:hypothetical protein